MGKRVVLEADPLAIPYSLRELLESHQLWDKFKKLCIEGFMNVYSNQNVLRSYIKLVLLGCGEPDWQGELEKIFDHNLFSFEKIKSKQIMEELIENSSNSFWKVLKDGFHYLKKGYETKDTFGYIQLCFIFL